MRQTGFRISKHGIDEQGFRNVAAVYWNERPPKLYELALTRNEGKITASGALWVTTGEHTGRSAQDKFIVRDATTEDNVWWDNNKGMMPESFATLHADMLAHAEGCKLFVQDLYGGADETYRLPTRVVTELAWHALFIQNLLIEPEADALVDFAPEFVIINLPSFQADPARHGTRGETVIAVNFAEKLVLIGGTSYAGETKKSVFSMLNYILPPQRVMPMHCSVNVGQDGDSAIFFGLSGTGKTTLSAEASRTLIGDDEHGWSENGVFNFEGGCYAKMINLSSEAEPEIYATTQRFGTVLENVAMDEASRILDFSDNSLAENSRGAYPLSFIPNASSSGRAGHPHNVIMLTADAFGVLPPIARLTASQAMYHFLSGYTAKVAGTEKGVLEPEATFSTCFGAPFMPRYPSEYGNLLRDLIAEHNVGCWLVNTGWTGGTYGIGQRMPIKATRALLAAALDGSLNKATFRTDPHFGFEVPVAMPDKISDIDDYILDPRNTWDDPHKYDDTARHLVQMFVANFEKFSAHVGDDVRAAAPAAE